MLFVVTCLDGPGRAPARARHYETHKARLAMPSLPVTIVLSGPLVSDDDTRMIGSHFLVEAQDRAAVEAFLAQDPFATEEVWAAVTVHAFRRRIG